MSRRITLPGADELFRATGTGPEAAAVDMLAPRPLAVAPDPAPDTPPTAQPGGAPNPTSSRSRGGVRQTPRPRNRPGQDRRPSGRERHDEKITVYLSPEELVELEHARLALRQHGLAVDRGRIVREALSIVLADLDSRGDSSTLVRRLRDA
jgi:hypothetical protein